MVGGHPSHNPGGRMLRPRGMTQRTGSPLCLFRVTRKAQSFEEVFAAFVNDLRQAKTLSEANIAAGIAWNDLRGVTE
jgi:hypothetical protein